MFDCKDWIFLSIGLFTIIAWPLIIYFLKPRLKIEGIEYSESDKKLKITIANRSCFNATNLNLEVCTVMTGLTVHFEVDKNDFLILPRKKCKAENGDPHIRVFKSRDLASFSKEYSGFQSEIGKLKTRIAFLRIRLHARHSFTGFGHLQEFRFKYDSSHNKFIRVKKY